MTTRRRFLQGMAATSTLGLLHPEQLAWAASSTPPVLPDPSTAPFDHVVVLMFENRSFDHLLGWLPGSDGNQAGLKFTDQTGTTYPTYALGADTQGCDYLDPDHSWEGFVTQHNGGALDGWLKTPTSRGSSDTFPIGYYGADDLPALAALARSYTTLDRYFCSFAGETFPNRFYQHAARTDRDHNLGVTQTTLGPTIWDRLATGGQSAGYYFVDEPFIGLWGPKYLSIAHPVATFLAQAKAGTLPNVSFIDPSFANEDQGQSGDYHPHGDIRAGESFLSLIYNAVRTSPAWGRTVFVINFDEWGGFYDHVVPPKVIDDTVRAALTPAGDPVPDYTQLGFRVPCIVVSPFSSPRVHHDGPYEHTSILKMIEWRWRLDALTARDANARNLAEVLDFSMTPRTDLPDVPVLPEFVSMACGPTSTRKHAPTPVSAEGASSPRLARTSVASGDAARGGGNGGLFTALPRSLPATGGHQPVLAAAAALGGGMAALAATRRLALAQPGAAPDPIEALLASASPPNGDAGPVHPTTSDNGVQP